MLRQMVNENTIERGLDTRYVGGVNLQKSKFRESQLFVFFEENFWTYERSFIIKVLFDNYHMSIRARNRFNWENTI